VIAIDPAPQPEDDRHITDQWLCQMMPSLPDLEVPSIDSIVPYLPPPRLGRIIIHPGSGGREKCCPLQLLIDVVNRLTAVGLEVEWMLGPVEIELFDTPMRQKMEESAPVSCYREVEHAARAVAGSKAFVGNDAGMTHVAGVCGVPTLALFGPTNPRIWRPLGPRVRTFDFRTLSADELADAITTYVS
jgi:ADP-heptose:LPS heptosyltransferase